MRIEDDFWQQREEELRNYRRASKEKKETSDLSTDMTPKQLELLLRWGDTLHFYRQLPIEVQAQTLEHLEAHERIVLETLGDITLIAVRNQVRRNHNVESGALGEGKSLCYGFLYEDSPRAVAANDLVENGRFGYEFNLMRGGQTYSLMVFFRGGDPLTDQTKVGLENESLESRSIIDFPVDRTFQPFPIFRS